MTGLLYIQCRTKGVIPHKEGWSARARSSRFARNAGSWGIVPQTACRSNRQALDDLPHY